MRSYAGSWRFFFGIALYHLLIRLFFRKCIVEKKKMVTDFFEEVREHIRKLNSKGDLDYKKLTEMIEKNSQSIEQNKGNISRLRERFNAYGTTTDGDKEF